MRPILLLFVAAITTTAFTQDTIVDAEGNQYPTVRIGTQRWATRNLRTTSYSNGDPIPLIQSAGSWSGASEGAYCTYGDVDLHGRLYNGYAVMDPRGVCPLGYHVATEAEFSRLISEAGGSSQGGGALKATYGWDPPNTGASNSTGFSATGSGRRSAFLLPPNYDTDFDGLGHLGHFWTTSPHAVNFGNNVTFTLIYSAEGVYSGNVPLSWGHGCRCIRSTQLAFYNKRPNRAERLLALSTVDSLVPFKVCADSSRSSRLKMTCSDRDPADIRFRMAGDPGGSDILQFGGVQEWSMSQDTLVAIFTHPAYVDLQSGMDHRMDTLIAYEQSSGEVVMRNPIEIYRAPVVFMHGMLGSAGSFEVMHAGVLASGQYPVLSAGADSYSPLLWSTDYFYRSIARFKTNRMVVPNALDKALGRAVRNGYSCGKADIVGHSMGGLLPRIYLQSGNGVGYRNDMSRLITVNTPHYGTQFANFGLTDLSVASLALDIYGLNPRCGVVYDLCVDSRQIRNVVNEEQGADERIPSTTLSTTIAEDGTVFDVLAWPGDWSGIFHGETNDLIVPLTSQRCGLDIMLNIDPQEHSGSTQNSTILAQVLQLLGADPQSVLFTQDGFPIDELQPMVLSDDADATALSVRDVGSDTISIVLPTAGAAFPAGAQVSVEFDATAGISHASLLVYGPSIAPFAVQSSDTGPIEFQVPPEAIGRLDLAVLGGDDAQWLANDTSHIWITNSIAPTSLSATPAEVELPLGLVQGYSVVADMPDAGSVHVNEAQELVVQVDPMYMVHLGNGQLQALAAGSTEVVFGFNGVTDTVHVDIVDDPSALAAAFDYGDDQICEGGTVLFSDYSQGLVIERQWSFPGGVPSSSTDAQVTVTYPLGGSYLVQLITTFVNGQDTMLINDLITVHTPIVAAVLDNGDGTLQALPVEADYQWVDCNNDHVPIPGATDPVFAPAEAGMYAVRASVGGCSSLSDCVVFIPTGVDYAVGGSALAIMPNPNSGRFDLVLPPHLANGRLSIRDACGRVVLTRSITSFRSGIEHDLAPGVYLLDVEGGDTMRMVVRR